VELSKYVRDIESSSGTAQKMREFNAALKSEDGDLFKRLVVLAMEPTVLFGITKKSLGQVSNVDADPPDSKLAVLNRIDLDFLEAVTTGEVARSHAVSTINKRLTQLHENEGRLLIGIVDKNLRWGLGASSINKEHPGFLTEFNVMLAAKYDAKKIQYPCLIEPKYDGMRVVAMVSLGTGQRNVRYYTRSGKDVESLPSAMGAELFDLARAFNQAAGLAPEAKLDLVFDGEIMGQDFKETMEKGRRKSETFETARFHVFDWLPRREFNVIGDEPSSLTYRARRDMLNEAFKGSADFKHVWRPQGYLAGSEMEVTHYYETFRDSGHEGAIVKNLNMPYQGKRSIAWIKMKAEETEDLKIVGYVEGEGKYVGSLGALLVDRNGVIVRVGGGFSDEERADFWANQKKYLGKLIEVSFQEATPDGSLRHPRFVRLRMDKSEW
jgi:DNA ligase-1